MLGIAVTQHRAGHQVVRHFILAQLLLVREGLGEIQGQFVAGGAKRQLGGNIPVPDLTVRMREGSPETGDIGLVVTNIGITDQVFRRFMAQSPGLAGVLALDNRPAASR